MISCTINSTCSTTIYDICMCIVNVFENETTVFLAGLLHSNVLMTNCILVLLFAIIKLLSRAWLNRSQKWTQ